MLHDGREALVVDPGDAQAVMDALSRASVALKTILVTHHHLDHIGGVPALWESSGAQVYAPAGTGLTTPLSLVDEGSVVSALGMEFTVLNVPGHTAGDIAFFGRPPREAPLLFCGDTLFSVGCGRLLGGAPSQLLASLQKLSTLPVDTRICPAHEYTLNNIEFAMQIEPANPALLAHQQHCRALRAAGRPTLPSCLGLEQAINPFLRTHLPHVAEAVIAHDAYAASVDGIFAALRQWKNTFP